MTYSRMLLALAFLTSTLSAEYISIPLFGYQLSLFRLLLLLSFCMILFEKKGNLFLYKGKAKYSVSFMLVWFVYAIITGVWVRDITNYIRNLFFLGEGLLAVVISVNCINNRNDVTFFLKSFEVGAIIQSVIGWYEIITKDYRWINFTEKNIRNYLDSNNHIPIAMLNNPNDFATLMFLAFFIALILMMEKRKINFLQMLVGINFGVLLFMTTSRANILGLLLGILFIVMMIRPLRPFVVLSSIIAFLLVPQIQHAIQNLLTLDFTHLGSDSERLALILSGLRFLSETYGFGVGNGQIEIWMATKALYNTGGILNMHNWWIEILTSYGVVIFVGYLYMFFGIFRFFYYKCNKDIKLHQSFHMGVCAIFVGSIIALISSSSNMSNEWLWMFWGVCIAYQDVNEDNKKTINENIKKVTICIG